MSASKSRLTAILKLKDGVHIDYATETKVTLTIHCRLIKVALALKKTFTLRVDERPALSQS